MLIPSPFDRTIVKHSSFDCGEPELDEWLKRYADRNEKSDNTRTFLLLDEKEVCVAGYVATLTYRFEPEAATAAFGSSRYPVPAVLIARLAVDRRYQGQGIGRVLLLDTLQRLEHASRDVGFEVVVVDALHENAAGFYLRHGFRRTLDDPLRLFLTTKSLRETFAGLA